MGNLELKIVKNRKLDKELTLKVMRHKAAERIFVEFTSKDGRLVVQKSFQDNFRGRSEAKIFEDKFKSIGDLKRHFGFK
jgi:hypothetical protein